MGSKSTWGISQSLMDPYLDCMAHQVILPTHTYPANPSQPSLDMSVRCHVKWVTHPQANQDCFCAFFYTAFVFSHDNMLLSHSFHMELYLFWWLLGDHQPRSFDVLVEIFWGRGEDGLPHLFDCDFNSGSKSVTQVSSDTGMLTFNVNLCFSNVAMFRHFCLAAKRQERHWAEIYLFWKLFAKIRKLDVGEIPVAVIFSFMSLDLQESPPQVSHFVHLLMFLA